MRERDYQPLALVEPVEPKQEPGDFAKLLDVEVVLDLQHELLLYISVEVVVRISYREVLSI